MYYRGSPANSLSGRGSIELLTRRLAEAEFVFGDDGQAPTSDCISVQHEALRQEAISDLRQRRAARQFEEGWQREVLPVVHWYTQGRLFPLLKKERPKRQKPADPEPTNPLRA